VLSAQLISDPACPRQEIRVVGFDVEVLNKNLDRTCLEDEFSSARPDNRRVTTQACRKLFAA
jgi:hypothetical protein